MMVLRVSTLSHASCRCRLAAFCCLCVATAARSSRAAVGNREGYHAMRKIDRELKAGARELRRAMPDDPQAVTLADQIDALVKQGRARRGPYEPKPRPVHRLWKKPPPEYHGHD